MDPFSSVILSIAGILGLASLISSSNEPSKSTTLVPKIVSKNTVDDRLERLLKETEAFFSDLLKYPLTKEQRIAILDSRKSNLVLASAGCGKTSVLVAKYAYLNKYHNVPNQNILLLKMLLEF